MVGMARRRDPAPSFDLTVRHVPVSDVDTLVAALARLALANLRARKRPAG
jgi:hypothetical protein